MAFKLTLNSIVVAVRSVFRFRGDRVIVCPETGHGEMVRVDIPQAALSALGSEPALRLSACTRWPEKQDCGQMCLQQIEDSPEGCLIRHLLEGWYAGKDCVYCHRPLDHLSWLDHHPTLMGPDRVTHEWKDIAPRDLPEVFATHQPVCWDCHIAEMFRREHPDLVTDRNFRNTTSDTGRKS